MMIPRRGLTLLEVLVAAALLAAVGVAAVSLLRSLADADRDRRAMVLAPMVMAAANAGFDRARSERPPSTASTADPFGWITESSIEVDGTAWIVEVTPAEPETDAAASPEMSDAASAALGARFLRFAARPASAPESHEAVVWWRAIPTADRERDSPLEASP